MQAYTTPPPPAPQTSRALILESLCTRMHARQRAKLAHLRATHQTWQHEILALRRPTTPLPTTIPLPTPTRTTATPPPQASPETIERYWQRMAKHTIVSQAATKPAAAPVNKTTVPVPAPVPVAASVESDAVSSVEQVAPVVIQEPRRADVVEGEVAPVSGVHRPNLVLYLRRVVGRWIAAIQRDDRAVEEGREVQSESAGAATLGAAAQALIVILSAGMGKQ